MPMKAVYDTIDGEIVSETRNGVRRDYLPDPLGSTAALLDSSQTKTETASYWPYGEQRGIGMLSTPFGYVGTLGYYADDTDRVYVRARTLLTKKARWLTVDPLWPGESAYGYSGQNPMTWADPSGYQVETAAGVVVVVGGIVMAIGAACAYAYQNRERTAQALQQVARELARPWYKPFPTVEPFPSEKPRTLPIRWPEARCMPRIRARAIPKDRNPFPIAPIGKCKEACHTFCTGSNQYVVGASETYPGEYLKCVDGCTSACQSGKLTFTYIFLTGDVYFISFLGL